MGKHRSVWNEQRYLRDLKRGVSQGSGANYIPGITIHDFPSKGISVRILGRTTGRIHHLLSRNEEYYFYLLDTDPDVLDIQEQFWLRMTETLEIASRFNIRHPHKGRFPSPISTDFLITRRDGLHARTVKQAKELENLRVREKFSIEYHSWKEKGIDWKIVTEEEINRDRARNLQWLYTGPALTELIPEENVRKEAGTLTLDLINEQQFKFSDIIEIVEEGLNLIHGSAICLFKELVLSDCIHLNLDRPLNFMNPLAKEA